MSVLKGLVQLDMLSGIYPSIIMSRGGTEAEIQNYNENYNSTILIANNPPIQTLYTNVFAYLMTYVPGFRNELENYIENYNGSRIGFNLPGFVRNSSIGLSFNYMSSGKYPAQLYVDIAFYDENNEYIMGWNNIRIYQGTGKEALKKYLFTANNGEIYFVKYSPYYDIDNAPQFCVISKYYEKDADTKVWSKLLKSTAHNIPAFLKMWSLFQAPKTEELPDTPVGAPEGNNTDAEIGVPGLPTVSILDGLHHMYCPDSANVKKMGRALWSPNFFDNVVKIFANPVEAIVSLSLSPIKPTVSENPYNIVVGNIELQTTTGVETSNVVAPILTSQYGTYSFGDLPLYEKYSSYLDYNTTVQIYLPFIGVRDLSVNDVMGKVLSLTYNVDFFTGDFIAVLKCGDPYGTLKSVLYHWNGNILSHLPISSSDFSNGILSGLSTSLSIATGLAVGGPGGAVTAVGGSLGSLGGFKPAVDKGGSTSSNVGMLDNFNAYLIVTKPIEDKPKEYNTIKGGTVNKNIKLTQGLGYVVCGELHLENIGNATSEEKTELENLLKSGVIL